MRPPIALAAVPAAVVAAAVALVVGLSGSSGDAIAQAPPQLQPAPERQPGEGAGPFNTLVIRGATMIDGTGAEPQGPVDIVVRRNRIAKSARSPPPTSMIRGRRSTPTMRSTPLACT